MFGLGYFVWFAIDPQVFSDNSHAEDPMAVSGFGCLLAGIVVARWVQSGFLRRIDLMVRSGAIQFEDSSHEQFNRWFQRSSVIAFLFVCGTLLPLYLIGLFETASNEKGKIHLYIGGAMGVWLVSTRFAFGVATGLAAYRLSHSKNRFILAPSHPDRSSGFGHLGHFYFDQALVLLLPAIFMLFWIIYVGVNIDRLQRAELADQFISATTGQNAVDQSLEIVLENYMTCKNVIKQPDSIRACPQRDRQFIWLPQFVRLILFNLVIFMFSWVLPNLFLGRRMRAYRAKHIEPEVSRIEDELRDLRTEYPADPVGTTAYIAHRQQLDELAEKLAVYRSCPAFPLPILTVLTATISNISAILGLVGAFAL